MTVATAETVPGLPGRYRIAKTLADTGHSDVYLALDEVLCRQVAIKVLRSDACAAQRAAFVESHRIAAGLHDARVVVVHDAADPLDGRAWAAMQYHPQGSLADELRRSGPMPADRVVEIAESLADLLRVLHRDRRLLHRGIRPSNVLLHADGSVALADFGIAVAPTPATTTAHTAPEVGEHGGHGVASEVYALGVTVAELLGGRPFARPEDGTDAVPTGLPEALGAPDVPPPLVDLLARMVAADPARRPATWDDVVGALRALPVAVASPPAEPDPDPVAAAPPIAPRFAVTAGRHRVHQVEPVDGEGGDSAPVAGRPARAVVGGTPGRRRLLVVASVAALAVVAALGASWLVTPRVRPPSLAELPGDPLPTASAAATTPSTSAIPAISPTLVDPVTALRTAVSRVTGATRTRRATSTVRPSAANSLRTTSPAPSSADVATSAEPEPEPTSQEPTSRVRPSAGGVRG